MKSKPVTVGHGTYWYDPGYMRIWWRECTAGVRELIEEMKETNPKDKIGSRKWRQYFCIPARVTWEVGIAHLVGRLKYGGINWRGAGVQASVYIDAAKGHIDQWVEGEDLDPESQANHLAHAIAGLNILLDCILRGEDAWTDDRPPKTPDLQKVREETQAKVDRLFEMFPNPPERCTELNYREGNPAWEGGRTKEPPEKEGTKVQRNVGSWDRGYDDNDRE